MFLTIAPTCPPAPSVLIPRGGNYSDPGADSAAGPFLQWQFIPSWKRTHIFCPTTVTQRFLQPYMKSSSKIQIVSDPRGQSINASSVCVAHRRRMFYGLKLRRALGFLDPSSIHAWENKLFHESDSITKALPPSVQKTQLAELPFILCQSS